MLLYFIDKSSQNSLGTAQLMFLVWIILLIPELSMRARRLHDINKSGWWQLLNYTGIGFFYILYLHIITYILYFIFYNYFYILYIIYY